MYSIFISIILFSLYHGTYGFGYENEAAVGHHSVSGLAGESVKLPCVIDRTNCGELHNIKWYKNNERVFIFSEIANIKKHDGGVLIERAKFHYSANETESWLEISPLWTGDESIYKCEITYLAVSEECSVVQFVNLTTLARPMFQQMTFEDGSPIDNGATIGPFDEDSLVTVSCESGGGKPIPSVTWWHGSEQIEGDYRSTQQEDGLGTGFNTLTWSVSRNDLGKTLTCQVMNAAMSSPTLTSVSLNINVAPQSVTATKKTDSINDGELVQLECAVKSAKPPARIVWYNGTVPAVYAKTSVNIQEAANETKQPDGTYDSHSTLTFPGTRWENELEFSCQATNDVTVNRGREPITDKVVMDVRYAPTVRVSPENITVNETMDVLIFCQYSANPKKLLHVMWYLDGVQVDVSGNPDKYGNGDVNHPTLLIKNTSASDMGNYTCRVANEIDVSQVTNFAYVNVQYQPSVQVIMDPPGTISESSQMNVTLICDVIRANPLDLLRVRWYLDGVLLKELPECDGNSTVYEPYGLCDIDPTRLLLEDVLRDFQGNYSCKGMNEAGWGPRSAPAELIIHYPPGPAYISANPEEVIKGEPLTLTCVVDDPGRPVATTYKWTRGNHSISTNGPIMHIDSVSLETEAVFTCLPVNSEGEGVPGTISIDVLAKPTFITRLPPYHGELINAENVELRCQVECSPLCNITWYKDDDRIYNNSNYIIHDQQMQPDPSSGDLESVLSILSWRMSQWPGGELDRIKDNANYTCIASDNEVGDVRTIVSSHTFFKVEYPPEEILVTPEKITVTENEIPKEKIECKGWSYPEPTYVWHHGTELISSGSVLNLDRVNRFSSGKYRCTAQNRHGNLTTSTLLDVRYRPECKIDRIDEAGTEEGKILLICLADANPTDVTFRWRTGNETLIPEEDSTNPLQSKLILDASAASLGTYYCYVNNTIGDAIPCEIDITGVSSIMEKLGDDNIVVISAIVAAVIILIIIVCIIIILICRRQRQAGKYPDQPKATSVPKSGSPPGAPSDTQDNGHLPKDDEGKMFYENLPFHGILPPPNKPLIAGMGDFEYADVDYSTYAYGPIQYKQASILAAKELQAEKDAEREGIPVRPPRRK